MSKRVGMLLAALLFIGVLAFGAEAEAQSPELWMFGQVTKSSIGYESMMHRVGSVHRTTILLSEADARVLVAFFGVQSPEALLGQSYFSQKSQGDPAQELVARIKRAAAAIPKK